MKPPERLGPAELVLLAFSGPGLLALVFLGTVWLPSMARLFADFGSASLPLLTRVILSRLFLLGCAAGIVASGAGGALVPWPRARLAMLILALTIAVLAVAATLAGAYLPLFQLADAVRAE